MLTVSNFLVDYFSFLLYLFVRVVFGSVCKPSSDTLMDGACDYREVKAPPFIYTNRLVVAVKKYYTLLYEELSHVKGLRREWGPLEHGYAERYPPLEHDYMVYVYQKVNR